MRRAHAEPRRFRRSLKPRWGAWLRHWIVMSGTFVVLTALFRQSIPGFWNPGRDDFLLGTWIATSNLISVIYSEWKRQPRRLLYWSDETPSGIIILHLYTGQILFRTDRVQLEPDGLHGVDLTGADLRGESLTGLDLRFTKLQGACLEEATLFDCCLDGADLTGCQLACAWLRGASFKGADLRGADFRGRGGNRALTTGRMEGAHFFGARYNAATRWPPGFDPAAHGCAYENDAEQPLPIPAAAAPAEAATLPITAMGQAAESDRAAAVIGLRQ